MDYLIKTRHRNKSPAPWRWEIFDKAKNKLVTSSGSPSLHAPKLSKTAKRRSPK
jgi:hypothetical protein